MTFTLATLQAIIRERASAAPDSSWTAQLLAGGPAKTAKKFGEEAVELVIAAIEGNKPEIVKESADVIFHLLVMLEACDVSFEQVLAELEQRTRQSGLTEKAARKQ